MACLLAVGLYVASRCPVPINYIVYAVCAIVIVVALLETTGLMDGGTHGSVLNHRI